jgi:hypothetical protein
LTAAELALALALLESKAHAGGYPPAEDAGNSNPRRYRGWETPDAYDPADIGSAISNAVRASRRIAGRKRK